MAVATKTMSTHVGGPWCWYISNVICLLSIALLQWSLYPCQHSRREYCLTISFLVIRLVECHELSRVEERGYLSRPILDRVQNTVTVVVVTLLLYHSLYSVPSLHPYYVFGHALLCHRFFGAQPSRRLSISIYVPPLLSTFRCCTIKQTADWIAMHGNKHVDMLS